MANTGKIKTPSFNPLPQKLLRSLTKIKSPQRTVLSTKWRLVIAAEILLALILMVLFVFYIIDQRQMIRISAKKQVQNLTRLEQTLDEISRKNISDVPRSLSNQALTYIYEIAHEDESISTKIKSSFLLANFLPKTDSLIEKTESFVDVAKTELKMLTSESNISKKQALLLSIDKKIESISTIKKTWQELLNNL